MRHKLQRFLSLFSSLPDLLLRRGLWVLLIGVISFAACSSFQNTAKEAELHYQLEKTWGQEGSAPGDLKGPMGLALDSSGHFYVADAENSLGPFVDSGSGRTIWGKREKLREAIEPLLD